MKHRVSARSVLRFLNGASFWHLAVGFAVATVAIAAWALTGTSVMAATAPPDWTGVWQNYGAPTNTNLFDGATSEPYGCSADPPCRSHPPYNAKWEALYEAKLAKAAAQILPDPLTRCMPRGTPGNMRSGDGTEFVIRPERVWIFMENVMQARHIYTDGRGHRTGADGFNNFTGDSIGHWEGDTLVVDTVHIKGGLLIDRSGASLSSQAHIVERIHRRDANTMQDDLTITDPEALTRPWLVTRLYKRAKGVMYDFACGENIRNPINAEGRTLMLDADGKVIDKGYEKTLSAK